jgi:hypothetical protein
MLLKIKGGSRIVKRKNIIFLGLTLLVIFSFSLTTLAKEQVFDFRKTNWGMSVKQVKAIEDAKLGPAGDSELGYSGIKIDGKDFICVYFFLEDKLYRSAYGLLGEHSNDNLYIDDYENLKEALTKKYGKPRFDKVTWRNDLFKDSRQDWGTAISMGHLEYFSSWETSTTDINLGLNGDNYEISLNFGYYSRELKEWADKIIEEKTKSSL